MLGAVLRQFHPRLSRQFQQPVRIGHYLPQKLPPRFAVRPVNRRLALMLEPVPLVAPSFPDRDVRHGRQDPQQFDDPSASRLYVLGPRM